VQAYAALAFLSLAVLLLVWLPAERRRGDVSGLWLMGAGVAIYITELWRDWEGRGPLLRGAIDGPQIAAVLFVLAGALVLRERKGPSRAPNPIPGTIPGTISNHASPSGEDRGSL
jgi:phosphatidylglycerol:prolipoprotein diacylglycerol transferase